jgi:hypothetical protein
MKVLDFFKPSWKKIYWFFLVYLVSELYSTIIIGAVPFSLMANLISFLLKPFAIAFGQMQGIEAELAMPLAKTLDIVWLYLIATILAKEVSKDKE